MNLRPTVCIDFDGVIHSYDQGWRRGVIYGTVLPGFWNWATEAQQAGLELVVYSSRSKDLALRDLMAEWLIQQWAKVSSETWVAVNRERGEPDRYRFNLDKKGTEAFTLTFAHEKPAAFVTIDDRAIQFKGSWADPALQPEAIRNFQPWNKS